MSDVNNFFDMSDEDFAKSSPNIVDPKDVKIEPNKEEDNSSSLGSDTIVGEVSEEVVADADDINKKSEDDDKSKNPSDGDDNSASDGSKSKDVDPKADDDPSDEELEKSKAPVGDANKKPKTEAAKEPSDKKVEAEPKNVNENRGYVVKTSKELSQEELATFYDEIMKPIKANGKTITLRNRDEVVRMIQMGAGYGRKLNDIQPHLKTLRMLENNSLLDEEKLSYLIDLHQKNPDAIKKLVKESGIDPLDFNTDDAPNYKPTNHSVSDNEVVFSDALKEVGKLPGGQETIQLINEWDKTSKEALWAEPQLLGIIQSQRENGIYDQIASEIDRKKLLGEIPNNMPFIQAYKIAGDALVAANALYVPGDKPNIDPSKNSNSKEVIDTRVIAPKSKVQNNDKAKSAASPSAVNRPAKPKVNPLELSDEEFLKNFGGRL